MLPRALVSLAAAVVIAGSGSHVALASTHPPAGKLLFSAAFTPRSASRVPGFHASQGRLSFDGSNDASYILPFSLKKHPNFEVRAVIRQRGATQANSPLVGYGITVHQSRSNPDAGVFAGSFFSTSSLFNDPLILWGGDSVGGAAFSPGSGWNTYRLDVQGSRYRLYIDGRSVISFTITDFLHDNQIGIYSAFVSIQVKSFEVFALPSAAAPAALPPVKAVTLQPGDLPSSFQAGIGHFSTDQEAAKALKTSEATVQAQGRIVGYETSFEDGSATTGLFFVTSTLTAYTSSDAALKDFDANVAADRSALQTSSNAASFYEQTETNIGEKAVLFSLDYSVNGQAYHECVLELQRGAMRAVISASFVGGDDPASDAAQTLALGKIVDMRIINAS